MRKSHIQNDTKAGFIGTLASSFSASFSAFFALPLTREFVIRQTNPTLIRSFQVTVLDVLNKKAMQGLSKVSGSAILHGGARSFASLGVVNIVLKRMESEVSVAKKGLYAGLCAGFSQAILTTGFSHSVIAGLSGQPQLSLRDLLRRTPVCYRVYSIAMLKNSVDQGLALMFSQMIQHSLLKEGLLDKGPALSLMSGVLGAGASTVLSMPLIAAETNVLSQPGRPLGEWVSQMSLRKDPRLLWRGWGFRLCRASMSLGVGLAALDVMNRSL